MFHSYGGGALGRGILTLKLGASTVGAGPEVAAEGALCALIGLAAKIRVRKILATHEKP
jgi:hypothetical protein